MASEDISLDPRRQELLEARIFGTGPRGARAPPTNAAPTCLLAPGTVDFSCNNLVSDPQTSSSMSSCSVQLSAPPPGTNECSNLSSAGSTSDREPDTPEKPAVVPNPTIKSSSPAHSLPAAKSAERPRKRRKKKEFDAEGNIIEGSTAKTPKSDRKITDFLKTSPNRAAAGAALNNGQTHKANASNFQPGALFAPISAGLEPGPSSIVAQRLTPTHQLVTYASSDSNQSPPGTGRVNSTYTQTDPVDVSSLEQSQRQKEECEQLRRLTVEYEQNYNSQGKRLEEATTSIEKFRTQMKKLLIDQSTMERKTRKAKVMEACVRLGQFRPERRVGHFEEVWVDGTAFEEVTKRLKEIKDERDDIVQATTLLRKRKPSSAQLAREARRAQQQAAAGVAQLNCVPNLPVATTSNAPDADGFARPDPPNQITAQEFNIQDEIFKLKKDQLKKEETELQGELDRLDRDRNLHIRELKRVQNEEASRYKDHVTLGHNDRYLLLSLLGKGGFSEVWKSYDLEELRIVACKIHHVNREWKEDKKANYVKHALREKDIHKTLEHLRIVKLYDVFTIDNHSFCTVLEYCSGNDLDFYLKQNKTIPEKEARSIIMQVVSALHYLNLIKPPIIHYDLKPANILLQSGTAAGELKITDFGLSKIMEEDKYDPQHGMDLTSQGAGTYWYLPPECFVIGNQPPKINSKVDVWSVGIIFYQCLYGKRPFGHDLTQAKILEENTILNATEVTFPTRPNVSSEAKNFINRCLQYRKEDRADVSDLYALDYFKPRSQKSQSAAAAASPTPSPGQSATSG